MNILVAYHGRCMDGMGAADSFANSIRDTVHLTKYVPISYGQLEHLNGNSEFSKEHLPSFKMADIIYFLDISPQLETLKFLTETLNKRVVILDHHATAAEMFKTTKYDHPNLRVLISTNGQLSGCTLVEANRVMIKHVSHFDTPSIGVHNLDDFIINFIVDEVITDVTDPIYTLIGIRDVWLVDHPNKGDADKLNSFMRHYDMDKTVPGTLHTTIVECGGIKQCVDIGAVIDSTLNNQAKKAIDNSKLIEYSNGDGEKVIVKIGNCPDGLGTVFGSVGYSEETDPCMVVGVFATYKDYRLGLSIRSKGFNCRVVAEQFGGGGHDTASGVDFGKLDLTMHQVVEKINDAMHKLGYFKA